MKKIKYLLLALVTVSMFSCEKIENDVDKIGDGTNIAGFESYRMDIVGLADGSEWDRLIQVRLTGPSVANLTNDVTLTLTPAETSTGSEGTHYRWGASTNTVTLTKENNYLANVDIILVTEGNAPPKERDPDFESYVAPYLDLTITDVSGESTVVATGKPCRATLRYTPPNPFAGIYDTEMRYFHPTAGGSHPSVPGFDVDDPYGGIRAEVKELRAITGRKCETTFGVWDDLCWITVNLDNSITYEVDATTWNYDVEPGDPFNTDLVSRFDPETGIIYLYYNYAGGSIHPETESPHRIFYEVFTPTF